MGWKRRKKPLTPAEALTLLKQQVKPYWSGSDPVVAGLWMGERASIYPLKPEFAKEVFVFIFVDFTHFSAFTVVNFIKLLQIRFQDIGIHFILILRCPYPELLTSSSLAEQKEILDFSGPMVIDLGDALSAGFGVKEFPSAIITDHGVAQAPVSVFAIKEGGTLAFDGSPSGAIEASLSQLLWKTDPGLPLFPPLSLKEMNLSEDAGVDVMSGSKDLRFKGKWERKENCIVSMEPTCTVEFDSRGDLVAIIAKQASKEFIFWLKVDQGSVADIQRTELLKSNDTGESYFSLDAGVFYPILKKVKTSTIEIRGKGLELYGVRFSK